MIEHPTSGTASRMVADRDNGLTVEPRITVISGSAYSPRTATVDALAHTSKKTQDFLRSLVGPLVAVATAAVGPVLVAATDALLFVKRRFAWR